MVRAQGEQAAQRRPRARAVAGERVAEEELVEVGVGVDPQQIAQRSAPDVNPIPGAAPHASLIGRRQRKP